MGCLVKILILVALNLLDLTFPWSFERRPNILVCLTE